jgi:hypothetical protein
MVACGRAVYNMLLSYLYARLGCTYTNEPAWLALIKLLESDSERASFVRTLKMRWSESRTPFPENCTNVTSLNIYVGEGKPLEFLGRLKLEHLKSLNLHAPVNCDQPKHFAPSFPSLRSLELKGYWKPWFTKAIADSCGTLDDDHHSLPRFKVRARVSESQLGPYQQGFAAVEWRRKDFWDHEAAHLLCGM